MSHQALCLHFFNPDFQLSTAKNEINLFNNHVLIVAPVTLAPAGAMPPSAEFLCIFILLHRIRTYYMHGSQAISKLQTLNKNDTYPRT